jgi:hypothetical protein
MSAFLLVLGVILTAVGVVAVGFGVPNHEFGLGNTFILAGTMAAIGGLLLIGLSAGVRQLRRIADTVAPRPVAPHRQPPAAIDEASARAAPLPRIPYPPKPSAEREWREPPAIAPPDEVPEEVPPAERPRPNIFGVARGSEPPEVEEPESVPLAPTRTPPGGRTAPPLEPPRDAGRDSKISPPDMMARLSNLATPPRQRAERPRPPERARVNMRDSAWPADTRAVRPTRSETIPRAPRLDPRPEPRPEGPVPARQEPRFDMRPESRPEPRNEPRHDVRAEPRFEGPREEAVDHGHEAAPDEPRVAILKSGVIDGMAYTLYTDGSIEAELPQGTMRFATIDQLRMHLEQSDRPERA